MQCLIYGANGYTARLLLPLAATYGLWPILAGRSAAHIEPLAAQFGLEYRIFDLRHPDQVAVGIAGVRAVLHCAGPFAHTAQAMMHACIAAGTHYLDITGEITVFEAAHALDQAAQAAGVTLLPGAGFDVVPSDCLARHLADLLPDATHLKLAFTAVGGGLSKGTALTMADTAGEGGLIRRDGRIERVPLGHRAGVIDFGGGVQQFCMAIPWGDVSTAYRTTGIPNIEVHTSSSPKAHAALRWQWAYNWLLRTEWMRNRLRNKIKNRPPGPSESRRQKGQMRLWGQVTNARGEQREARLVTPEGYTLTAHTALLLLKKILDGEGKPGFWTPAGLFGKDVVRQIHGPSVGDFE
jgi:short subunit dehydrogenase-like uncharacterized protein